MNVKKMSRMAIHGKIKQKINIYCNVVVYEAINGNVIVPDDLEEIQLVKRR